MSPDQKYDEIFIAKVPLSEQLTQAQVSPLKRYQDKVLGTSEWMPFLQYELITVLCSGLPGSLGYLLRKFLYPRLLKQVGSGVILGQGLVLRHPGKISLGDRVAIDDYGLIDGSGAGEEGIYLGDNVIVSKNCVIQGKTGPVIIGDKTDLGCNVVLTSSSGIYIGKSVLIASNCYLGGGRYGTDRLDIPMMEQGIYTKGPVVIEDDVWLGAGATVLDGVTIGKGSIIGAGAVVTKDLPAYSVAAGVPAKVLRSRLSEHQD
ncbi:MAG: acyltransferase [Microcoleaceae cyanobacterium]